jgi:hypothetical protein
MRRAALVLVVLLAATAAGCRVRGPQSVESSASDPAYAERFPAEMAAARANYDGVEAEAKRLSQGFEAHGTALAPADAAVVAPIVDRADAAGRSSEYVNRVERIEIVNAFFTLEKDTLSAKVGGAVDHAARKQGCRKGGGSAAGYALDKAVSQQLEQRLRERNAAHRQIEQDAKKLGVPRADVEEMVDAVSYASYLTHVGIERAEDRMQSLRDGAWEVSQTVDRALADAQARAGDQSLGADERREAEAARDRLQKTKGEIDAEVEKIDALLAEVARRTAALRDLYRDSVARLRARVGSAGQPRK